MKKSLILSGLLIAATTMSALAHGGATGIVKERMDAMSAMGKAIKSIAPMMRGDIPYNAEVVKQAAKTFEKHSGQAMTSLFPEGTGGKPSEADDRIWTDWSGFEQLSEQLKNAARGLALAAPNGLMAAGDGHMSSGSMMGNSSGMMGGSSMMGGGSQMGAHMTAEQWQQMPADGAFAMVTQTCSACHTKYRVESK